MKKTYHNFQLKRIKPHDYIASRDDVLFHPKKLLINLWPTAHILFGICNRTYELENIRTLLKNLFFPNPDLSIQECESWFDKVVNHINSEFPSWRRDNVFWNIMLIINQYEDIDLNQLLNTMQSHLISQADIKQQVVHQACVKIAQHFLFEMADSTTSKSYKCLMLMIESKLSFVDEGNPTNFILSLLNITHGKLPQESFFEVLDIIHSAMTAFPTNAIELALSHNIMFSFSKSVPSEEVQAQKLLLAEKILHRILKTQGIDIECNNDVDQLVDNFGKISTDGAAAMATEGLAISEVAQQELKHDDDMQATIKQPLLSEIVMPPPLKEQEAQDETYILGSTATDQHHEMCME